MKAWRCVVRTRSPCDRRVRVVEFTRTGWYFLQELDTRHACDIESVVSILTAEKQESLRTTLKKLGLAAQAAVEVRKGYSFSEVHL